MMSSYCPISPGGGFRTIKLDLGGIGADSFEDALILLDAAHNKVLGQFAVSIVNGIEEEPRIHLSIPNFKKIEARLLSAHDNSLRNRICKLVFWNSRHVFQRSFVAFAGNHPK